jgi:hypothetical protein
LLLIILGDLLKKVYAEFWLNKIDSVVVLFLFAKKLRQISLFDNVGFAANFAL